MPFLNQREFLKNIIFYYHIIKYNVFFFILINILVSLLDGIGITLFVPLITQFGKTSSFYQSSKILTVLLSPIKNTSFSNNIDSLLIFIIIIFFIKGLIRGLQVFYLAKIRYNIMNKIRVTLLSNLSQISFTGYSKIDTGHMMNNFTNEVSRIYNNMTNLFFIIQNFLMALTYIIIATLVNWKFAAIIILISWILHFSFKKVNNKTRKISHKITTSANKINKQFLQLISNFKYFKATHYLKKFTEETKDSILTMESLNYKMGKLQAIIEALKEPLAVAIIIILLMFQIKQANANIEILFISLILVYKAIININAINSYTQQYNQTVGSISSYKNINKTLNNYKETKCGVTSIASIKKIELRNISVTYYEKEILKNINLIINKGETIAIIGESGSGKTTLANILLGLILPNNGQLLINDINIIDTNLDNYNNKIGYVSQDIVIFNDTIFNNITLFSNPNTQNRLKFWRVVKMAALDDFVTNSIQHENTNIGENGVLISGGQKQRIAIARELFKEPQILILDEATSALDYETDKIIMNNLDELKGECTIIIIAHRLHSIKNANKIYEITKKTLRGPISL